MVLTIFLVSVLLIPTTIVQAASATMTVSGTPWGGSTCCIGATEGNVRFNVADLQNISPITIVRLRLFRSVLVLGVTVLLRGQLHSTHKFSQLCILLAKKWEYN